MTVISLSFFYTTFQKAFPQILLLFATEDAKRKMARSPLRGKQLRSPRSGLIKLKGWEMSPFLPSLEVQLVSP